ncbi:hypothetical protein IW261DRAFT_1571431 [Armillaria novae-zelandiae]|uniref:Uncharacterized protein n=1 Tax=Armillaria novae-zelandiae TaxID=153914 RepID=A0AA39NU89_9AGAR|nr:hypothetical protein IW261DRAFT_1571431 [Armillaria novae-zelandiae]
MSPSYYPPLHIAPLHSADSSGVSLLDDYDSSKPQTRVSYGGRRKIPIAVVVPGILIFIASAVLASSLLIWLQSRRVEFHIPREDQYFHNAVVAIEGTRAPHKLDDGSLESDTTMYGLAMSAVSAQLVSLTVPFLLGLLGYRLASMWILAQEKECSESMPTAAQYGLLVKLCGSANLFSAYETVRYLKRGPERRPRAPASLIVALIVLVLAIVLNHLLSAADLWLHTTASTFLHTSMTEIAAESMPAIGTRINLTACPGPALSVRLALSSPIAKQNYSNCAHLAIEGGLNSIHQWGNAGMIAEGLAVTRNGSSISRSVMVDDMAILVPSTMPENVDNLTFNSFGLVAQCQPTVDCLTNLSTEFYCPSFSPPYNSSSTDMPAGPQDYSRIDLLDLTTNAVLQDPNGGYPLDSVLNPHGARVIFYWMDEGTHDIVFPADGTPGWYQRQIGITLRVYWYVSTCNMKAYNVSLSYSTLDGGNEYALASTPVLSNFNTTSALFAAFDSVYRTNLVDYLKYTLRTSFTLSAETFNTILSQNMSYAALGLASPLFERDASTSGNTILLRSASRYPLAPLSMVLGILYAYALLALVLTVSSVTLSSREIVVTKDDGKEHRVTAIELVQLRLTNALASIAERFVDPARPELLLETSAVDMFHEHPHAERLGVIMKDYEGEDEDGMVRRTQSLRVESVERRLTKRSDFTTVTILETV